MWVNVCDGLPEDGVSVLVAVEQYKDFSYVVAYFEKGKWHVCKNGIDVETYSYSAYPYSLWVAGTVTKWMPIPE